MSTAPTILGTSPYRWWLIRFGNMVHTLNHVYVVDDIFRHHLQRKKHGHAIGDCPSLIISMQDAACALNRYRLQAGSARLKELLASAPKAHRSPESGNGCAK